METERFFDATLDGPHVSLFIEESFTIRARGLKMDELII